MTTQDGQTASADTASLRHTYHSLKVERIIRETHDSCSVVFEIPDQLREVFRYKAGQFLTLEVPYEGMLLKRCYSLASSPDWEPEHKVTIKRVDGGRISNWVNSNLSEGDLVKVLPPDGRFVMTHDRDHMVLFGGGSGVTPMISIVKTALKTTSRTMTLVYANRDERSIIFKAEIDALAQAHGDRLKVIHRLDNVDGFLKPADIRRFLGGRTDGEYFLCGPQPYMDVVEAGLQAAGVDLANLHCERFVSPADPKSASEIAAALEGADTPDTVQVTLGADQHDVPYEKGKSLLQATIDAGLDAPYSCEEGFCGCCTAQLLEGEVDMASDEALTADEKKRGLVLACQSRPTTGKCAIKFLDY